MNVRLPLIESRQPARRRAFTLLELLVVIGLIVLLSGLAVPAIRGLKGGSETSSASRQLLDDLGLARLKAITERTTVYVVFVPSSYWTQYPVGHPLFNDRIFNNLAADQLTGYALYVSRSVGDQPGAPNGRYLTSWKSLPDGVFVPQWKFSVINTPVFVVNRGSFNVAQFQYTSQVPFPYKNAAQIPPPPGITPRNPDLPYIAFNTSGGLTSGEDEFIPLARGDIFPILPGTALGPTTVVDALEVPPGNSTNAPVLIRINGLTGRARIEQGGLP
jgi:prepilin-type N-terminal cleavage/methylation domain-containing protein